jgi:endogenous inhibitor of DNA gyrase (YacG/DUF329 family)
MKCPICQAPCPPRAENPAYPFCSQRCQLVDLGRWLDGDYRIPGEPVDDILARPEDGYEDGYKDGYKDGADDRSAGSDDEDLRH